MSDKAKTPTGPKPAKGRRDDQGRRTALPAPTGPGDYPPMENSETAEGNRLIGRFRAERAERPEYVTDVEEWNAYLDAGALGEKLAGELAIIDEPHTESGLAAGEAKCASHTDASAERTIGGMLRTLRQPGTRASRAARIRRFLTGGLIGQFPLIAPADVEALLASHIERYGDHPPEAAARYLLRHLWLTMWRDYSATCDPDHRRLAPETRARLKELADAWEAPEITVAETGGGNDEATNDG